MNRRRWFGWTLFALGLGFASSASLACSKSEASESVPGAAQSAARGCIAATIEHLEHTDDRDGVEHDVRYKEHFVHCGDRVWTERNLPRGVPDHVARSHERHAMPPTFTLARLVERAMDDHGALSLVSRAERRIIAISPESYDVARFDEDFDAASHLIATRAIATMTPMQDREAPAGAEWRTRSSAGGVVRVLWSKLYDFPLQIESESGGGMKRDTIKVVLEPPPLASDLPWAAIGDYEKKRDTDYMD